MLGLFPSQNRNGFLAPSSPSSIIFSGRAALGGGVMPTSLRSWRVRAAWRGAVLTKRKEVIAPILKAAAAHARSNLLRKGISNALKRLTLGIDSPPLSSTIA